jgi:uncharacterized protein (TIGR00297 family)
LLYKDIIIGSIAIIIIALATLITQMLTAKYSQIDWLYRKILHLVSIITCAVATYYMQQRFLLCITFFVFALLLCIVVYKQWLHISKGNSYGIALFPLAFSILLAIPFFSIPVIVCSMAVLAIADAMAGIVGKLYGKQIVFLYEKKSIIGFIVFTCCTIITIAIFFNALHWQTILTISIIITLSELFSYRGSDNFIVPIMTALLLQGNTTATYFTTDTCWFILIAIVGGVFAKQKKWLTTGGIFAAVLVGGITIMYLGAKSILLPALFLGIGSLCSKLNTKRYSNTKTARNAIQVFANSIIASISCIAYGLTHNTMFTWCFIASYAISICDTCSSEIGTYCKGGIINIIGFKKMQVGLSGGISIQGTLGGILGCTILVIAAYCIWPLSIHLTICLLCTGIVGMLIDSVLGSLLQAAYINHAKQLEEEATGENYLLKGYAYITNNTVNLLSNLLTIIGFVIIYLFFIQV